MGRSPASVLAAFVVFAMSLFVLNATALSRLDGSRDGKVADFVSSAAANVPGDDATGLWRGWFEQTRVSLDGAGSIALRDGQGTRVLLVGDSVMENLAGPLAGELSERWGADVSAMTRRGALLGLPELYDWPAQVAKSVEADDIDVVIVLIDAKPLDVSGHPLAAGSDAWQDGYRAHVAELALSALDAGADSVVWLERPVTSDNDLESARGQRYASIREALAGVGGGVLITAAGVLTGPGGGFTQFVSVSGHNVKVRADDGVHLTPVGAELYAHAVTDRIGQLTD